MTLENRLAGRVARFADRREDWSVFGFETAADPSLHTPDLGGKATTKQVTDAVCEALWQAND